MAEFTDFEIQVDVSETEAWGGESRPLVPPGDYPLTVVGVEQKTSNSGNPMINVQFEVAEGESKGSYVWNNYVLTQKAMGRVKALMVACGAQLDKLVASQLMGQTIMGTVVHTEGQASIDEQGNPRPAKTFANVINERSLSSTTTTAAQTAKPPVLNKPAATTAKPTNGAPRRA